MFGLKSLSDQEIVSRLRCLVSNEKTLTLDVIRHLVEVHRRGLYLENAYGSLYEYCKGDLGYTDASAWRRARAAQGIIRCPEAWDFLEQGKINICTLGRVYKFVTPAVLREIAGKSRAEVELIAAVHDTARPIPDRARPVLVPTSLPQKPKPDDPRLHREVNSKGKTPPPRLRSEVSLTNVNYEQKWKIEGVVSKEVKAKLDRCKSLLSRKYPNGVDYNALMGELTDVFLEAKDPERKQSRGKKRAPKQSRQPKPTPTPTHSRHIPAHIKNKVWTRDHGRCAYVGTNGKRCNSTYNLQFDHYPVPFARGGPNTANNLRLLCARHNQYAADKTFGKRDYG